MTSADFLGLGWNFPVKTDTTSGQVVMAPTPEDGIRQSIWVILSTAPGERVMRPDFGCGISDLVFGVSSVAWAVFLVGSALPFTVQSPQ